MQNHTFSIASLVSSFLVWHTHTHTDTSTISLKCNSHLFDGLLSANFVLENLMNPHVLLCFVIHAVMICNETHLLMRITAFISP